MNFYAVLGIPPDAGEETIRHAYRILARRYHPDRGAASSAEKSRQVSEAYETLSDPRRRRIYDQSSLPHPQPNPPVEPIAAYPEPIYRNMAAPLFDELVDPLLRSLERDFLFGSFFQRW